MIKNRFFKSTIGAFAELAIVTQVDASDGTANAAQPSVATMTTTVSASPTAGHKLTLTLSNDVIIEYTAPATPTTAILNAGLAAAIEAALPPGSSVNFTGTTTQVLTIGVPDPAYNTVTITQTTTGNSWTIGSVATFAGGLAADATAADSLQNFVDNATAGSIWAFWDDTNLPLVAGDTAKPANAGRKFYYIWKQADAAICHRSSAIPVKDLTYSTALYNAGTAQVMTAAFGAGTYSLGQRLHIRIIDTTPTQLPYASYDYDVAIGASGINQAVTDLAALINAEKTEPIVTASGSTSTLTVTAIKKSTTFKLASYLEVTTAQPSDLSNVVFATTAKSLPTLGDIANVKELEQYYIVNNGGINYSPNGTVPLEFGDISSNIGTNSVTQFGFLLVKNKRTEAGVVRNYANDKALMLIAIKSTDVAALAAL